MKPNVVMLVSHPIQYYVPIYRWLAAQGDINLTVLFHNRVGVTKSFDAGFGREIVWDLPLLEGYKYEFLSDRSESGGICFSVVSALYRINPDVLLVHGYHDVTNILAVLASRLMGVPVLMRSDTKPTPQNMNPGLFKGALKRLVFKQVDYFLSIGMLNRKFYLQNGVPARKILFSPFSVENNFFTLDGNERVWRRKQTRLALGISDSEFVVLSASKLIKRKRVSDVISSCAQLQAEGLPMCLLIVGSGEEEMSLRAQAEMSGAHVVFVGFKNQTEIRDFYAASDVFVLPSELEPWGLAVNEAMASGLPCVVSDQVGAAPDLIEGKGTGIVYPCADLLGLAEALRRLALDRPLLLSCGSRALQLIADWDNSVCAKEFRVAIALAVKKDQQHSAAV
ncbi:glycosyltransferase family 4 protein [Uliginosibacterium sediminicola]|uniref:Glycosyltransferase family 4 protein n=1 Tax=Uliginosibacterium sediminicola TaxID=2024550 RepID=A0ABU9YZS1_9RHOO